MIGLKDYLTTSSFSVARGNNWRVEFANGENMDLIIMGNVKLRGISKMKALGSVSRRVSEMASLPSAIGSIRKFKE